MNNKKKNRNNTDGRTFLFVRVDRIHLFVYERQMSDTHSFNYKPTMCI